MRSYLPHLLLSMFVLGSLGCSPAYILGRDEPQRLSLLPASELQRTAVAVLREEEPEREVSVRASRLDLRRGTWLDARRFRAPVRRPVGLLIAGGITLGIGAALSVWAAVNQTDTSCNSRPYQGDFSNGGRCIGRDILTGMLAPIGGLHDLAGAGLLIAGAARWSPEL